MVFVLYCPNRFCCKGPVCASLIQHQLIFSKYVEPYLAGWVLKPPTPSSNKVPPDLHTSCLLPPWPLKKEVVEKTVVETVLLIRMIC